MKDTFIPSQDQRYKEESPTYKGQPLGPHLAQGPIEDRKCRDMLFLILFVAFWVGSLIIAFYSYKRGNPKLLAAPFDSSGYQCGFSPGYQSFPYAYYNSQNTKQFVCINSCSATGLTASSQCRLNNVTTNCTPFGNYSTTLYVTICYPQSSVIAQTISLGIGFFQMSVNDVKATWPLLFAILGIAMAASLLLMVFIKFCGACLVYGVIFSLLAALITLGILAFQTARNAIDVKGLDSIHDKSGLYAIAYFSWGVAGVLLIVILCSLKSIRMAVSVLRTTAQFVQQQCQVVLVPLGIFIGTIAFLCFWAATAVYIFSVGTLGQCGTSPYSCIQWNQSVKNCIVYFLFSLFWNCEFAIGLCQFVIASVSCHWYFSHQNGVKSPSSTIFLSFKRAFLYHAGSIAFGSLILCLLALLHLYLQVIHFLFKEHTLKDINEAGKFVSCCTNYLRCCVACFERFVRFITKNAFVMMAIGGQGFCHSAHQAFYLIMRTGLTYGLVHGVGHIITLLFRVLIAVLCTFSGYLMVTRIPEFSSQIYSAFFPTLVILNPIQLSFVIGFVVASLYMEVFGIGSDSILFCYGLELDINKGQAKSCPSGLKDVPRNSIQ